MDESKPIISVVVPVYNIEKWVSKCLESVCPQASHKVEIIIVDDGSTDGSKDICDNYKNIDSIKVLHTPNQGLVMARRTGALEATGEYITFVDGDDWIDVWYEKALEILMGNPVDILIYGHKEESEKGSIKRINAFEEGLYVGNKLEQVKEHILSDNYYTFNVYPHFWNKLIKREKYLQYSRNISPKVTFGEDVVCVYPCIWNSKSIYISKQTPYHYRQLEESMSHANYALDEEVVKSMYETMVSNSPNKKLIIQQIKKIFIYFLLIKQYSVLCGENDILYPFKIQSDCISIALYGAGAFGQGVKRYLDATDKVDLKIWMDQNYAAYSEKGENIESITSIKKDNYDYVFISILNEQIAESVCKEMISLGVPREKILYVRSNDIEQMPLPNLFRGLYEKNSSDN